MKQSGGEKGQALVLLGIGLVVLIGFIGLAVDGVRAYTQRRIMQNAADAGALAGVRTLAMEDASAAVAAATHYAVDLNGSSSVDVTVDGQQVTVVAHKTFPTYFARTLDIFTLSAGARASAQYGGPSELRDMYFFPVMIRDDDYIPNQQYEIWDDKKVYEDIPDNVIVGGNRGWANFNGGAVSKSEIKEWCENGWFGSIATGDWINGAPGTSASGIETTELYRIGDTVIIPMYDIVRPAEEGSGSGQFDYRVVSFASFLIDEVYPDDTPKKIVGRFQLSYFVAPIGSQQHDGLVAIMLVE